MRREEDGAFRGEVKRPWGFSRGLDSVLGAWRADTKVRRCTELDEILPGKDARFAPMPDALDERIRGALKRRGVEQLYSHQAESFAHASLGRSFVVSTPTASGKSLCYNLPVLDRLARDPEARALYLFPTKALSRDQEEALRGLMTEAGLPHGALTYDGDTPGDARKNARERSGVVLTNPDMLHTGILPHHANWARLFSNLRYVVIDELHTYRGVFGSHLANVLRRLERVARFHGSSPIFIFASATIGNPKEHAERMLGREVSLVAESGAPSGNRCVMIHNPPVVNAELGMRASYLKTAVRLASDLVRAEVPTLLFGQSRNSVEVMLKYLRDAFADDPRIDPQSLQAYRGGYLPGTRRSIEASLRAGEVRCVVATNALELGIDIGGLDAVVCAGYPGSIAGLWQRFGRAGRRGSTSLALLVPSSGALDQYLATHPAYLTGAPVEQARIDPDNVEILVQHLKCAAFELPFEEGESFREVGVDSTRDALEYLSQNEVLHVSPTSNGKSVYHWSTDAYPANHVSLRTVGWHNVVVIEVPFNRTIAEMDFRSAHTLLHEQAIYQQEGEQYQVEKLDLENHKAFVRKVAPDYFTTAMTYVKVSVLEEERAARLCELATGGGEVSVVEKVVGYKKIKFHTHENVGYGDVVLPEMQLHTTGIWITFPEAVVRAMTSPRPAVIDALRGVANALHTVAAIGLMIDPRDLGHTLGSRAEPDGPPRKEAGGGAIYDPTLFLYDYIPGGVGLAARLFEEREALLRRGRRLIERCTCEEGCPACIGPVVGLNGSAPVSHAENRKRLALEVLSQAGIVGEQ